MKTKKKLRVTFADGTVICYKDAVFTVLEVLRKIGSDRFEEINLEVNGRKLISPVKHKGMSSMYSKEIADGWYYFNQSDVYTKCLQLFSISRQLQLDLKIEMSEEFAALPNPNTARTNRPPRKVKVTMPDGQVIDYDRFSEVFMTFIDRLGPRRLAHVSNFPYHGSDLFTVTNPTGKRLRVADFLYVAVPQTAKETFVIIDMICRRLGLQKAMKVELLPCA